MNELEFIEWYKGQIKEMPMNKPNYKKPVVVKITERLSLSKLRDLGHTYFDMIWRMGLVDRNDLYLRLADWLEVPEEQAHFSRMNNSTCVKAIEACITWLNDNRRADLDLGAVEPTPYFELILNH